jgi:hypothetical protein
MGFWLGTDRQGNRWLTKLTGDFCAYREIVFGKLAQQMGWSCQSTVFMRLDDQSANEIGRQPGELHAAHWFLDEHIHPPCNHDCGLAPLVGKGVRTIEDIAHLSIAHILDWPKSDFAACLFGGNEPPGRLFTKKHEFVIIDSELMFSTGPCSFESTLWWGVEQTPRPSGMKLAKEVCSDLVGLGHQSLASALSLPAGVTVEERWAISPLLHKSFAHAQAFIGGANG